MVPSLFWSICRATSHNAISQSPFAATLGMFPVRLQIDLNNDGTINETRRIDNRGPLDGNANVAVSFSNVTLPAGTHRIRIFADVPGDVDSVNGCNGAFGCIAEAPVSNNEQTLLVTVARPSVTLGSYLINPDASRTLYGRSVSDISASSTRDIAGIPDEVGLYWEGTQIQLTTCVGTGPGFSGRATEPNVWATWAGYPNNDANITEPTAGDTTAFTITCDTTSGSTVTDTLLLTNGGTLPAGTVSLTPSVNNIPLRYGETLTEVPYTVQNSDPVTAADDTTITIDVAGTERFRDARNVPVDNIPLTRTETLSPTFTPPSAGTYLIEVCADHPLESRGPQCDRANLNVTGPTCYDGIDNEGDGLPDAEDPDCHTDGDPNGPGDPNTTGNPNDPACPGATCSFDPNDPSEDPTATAPAPTISADPTIIRQGDEVTLTWDPIDTSVRSCTLSANVPAPADGNVADSITFNLSRTTQFSLICTDDQSAEVTVRVIPILFET